MLNVKPVISLKRFSFYDDTCVVLTQKQMKKTQIQIHGIASLLALLRVKVSRMCRSNTTMSILSRHPNGADLLDVFPGRDNLLFASIQKVEVSTNPCLAGPDTCVLVVPHMKTTNLLPFP